MGTEPTGNDGRPGSEPVVVITRRMLRRVGFVALAVVVVAGIGVGAFFLGRSSKPTAQTGSGGGSTASSSHPATAEKETFFIPSTSMYPALKAGDTVAVNLDAYASSSPARGDIVVLRTPSRETQVCGGQPVPGLVTRIIGLPGETISARKGEVYITGNRLAEPWLPKTASTYTANFGPAHIPAGQYFLMGDNRVASCDSRMWGTVPGSYIVGKVMRVVSFTAPTTTTTTAPPAPTTTTTTTAPPPVPQVADCGGAPGVRPGSLYWCTSMCSSYMTNISWTTWGPESATGTGTWVTKTTTPRTGQTSVPCSESIPVYHPGAPIELSTPQYVSVCPSGAGPTTVLLFTHANVSVGVTTTSNTCRQ